MTKTKSTFDLDGRVIAITGGLGLLGRQFAGALLDAGANVALIDVREDRALFKKHFARASGCGRAMLSAADITNRASMEAAFKEIKAKLGVPYGLINNAAIDSPPDADASANGPFETYPEELWDQVIDVNLKGTFVACQVFGAAMAKAGRGSVINISSIYGLVSPDQSIYEYRRKKGEVFFKPVPYAASKSGVLNMTRYLATYWAAKNVRVNTLSFAGVANGQSQEFLKEYNRRVPMGRMAKPHEYNGAVVFLMSDAASYMTGSNMILDGGFTAW